MISLSLNFLIYKMGISIIPLWKELCGLGKVIKVASTMGATFVSTLSSPVVQKHCMPGTQRVGVWAEVVNPG